MATGLQQLQALMEQGGIASEGIGGLLGMETQSVEPGRVVFSMKTVPAFSNPLGTVHGGIMSTLLDSAMGCAVHASLEEGASYTTLELKVNFVRAAAIDGATLTCEGTVVHLGRRVATTEGRIVDGDGRLVAHGTSTCMIFPSK